MFLVEAPLGRAATVTRDGPPHCASVSAPPGFDSVIAVGQVSTGYRPSVGLAFDPTSVASYLGVKLLVRNTEHSLRGQCPLLLILLLQVGPDPAEDAELLINDVLVSVPQARPTPLGSHVEPYAWARHGPGTGGSASSFHHSEYLVYREAQHRIRYVLLLDWDGDGSDEEDEDDEDDEEGDY